MGGAEKVHDLAPIRDRGRQAWPSLCRRLAQRLWQVQTVWRRRGVRVECTFLPLERCSRCPYAESAPKPTRYVRFALDLDGEVGAGRLGDHFDPRRYQVAHPNEVLVREASRPSAAVTWTHCGVSTSPRTSASTSPAGALGR